MPNPAQALASVIAGHPALKLVTVESGQPSQPSQPSSLTPAHAAPAILAPAPGPDFSSLDQALRQAVDHARNRLVEVGYYGYQLILLGDWQQHGYESENSYRESLGVSPIMWRDYTGLAARLAHLSLADMQELTLSAAKSLATVRADLWLEFPWLEEAKLLPANEFSALVKQRLAKHPGKAGKLLREPRQDIRMAVPASQRAALESRLEALRESCSLATVGEALALALAAAEKLAKLAKNSPAAQSALDRSIEEVKRACS
jgi:hypothetical protein